jgi:hypothetical protein
MNNADKDEKRFGLNFFSILKIDTMFNTRITKDRFQLIVSTIYVNNSYIYEVFVIGMTRAMSDEKELL